jgi:fused signal recognition particle receptor
MPEGIVVELLIVLLIVVLIAGTYVMMRRRGVGPPQEREEEDRSGGVGVAERPAEAVEVPPEPPVAVRPPLRERLAKSRRFLADRLGDALRGGIGDETWDDVEATLIQADVGVDLAARIVEDLKSRARDGKKGITEEGIRALLVEELADMFPGDRNRALAFAPEGVTTWMIVGVNGTGKTTTIGKLATDLANHRRRVALAAADTFRAAADEQLAVWAERSGAELVKHQPGADPGAVAFDAHRFSSARGIDVLIVDTAGRLHTKVPLMDELSKVRRVLEREGEVHETLLVIDATAGQNGLAQAREFTEATGVTGVVLAKADGTAKGGIALAIEHQLGIPIKLIGVGEGVDDLEPFDPEGYVEALLS